MTDWRAGKAASGLMTDLKVSIDKAMTEARARINAATGELVSEVTDGSTSVEKALRQEARQVRAEFAEISGNAGPTTEEAVAKAESAVEAAKGNGLFPPVSRPLAAGG
ncbi:MAG: hypothetical protein ACLP19_05225 [Xanthobacteraceae bacterium]